VDSAGLYSENAYAVNDGKRLYSAYNCVGCHAHGGGGMGPPLMDDRWIYGSEPQNIYATIVQGRPNGMPSFRGKVPDPQVWQLVAYVRALGGLARKDVAPGRNDDMTPHPSEQSLPPQTPVPSSVPPASQGTG
jgi:cytochrome c oxidase cbb3-type subunit III